VVTADALHTQQDTARYLVEGKKADYLFTVKDNQPTLKQDIEDLHLEAFPPCAHGNR
jgi:predicted transposase YbfD/YdcC